MPTVARPYETIPASTTYPRPHRFTVDEYFQLATAGLFRENNRIELIYGELIDMAPLGELHEGTTDDLSTRLARQVPELMTIRTQGSVTIGTSAPQPDVMILKPDPEGKAYRMRHVTPADVLLLVEISDSTLHNDLTTKLRLYAEGNITEYWVVDIPNERVIQHTQPNGTIYQSTQIYLRGMHITSANLPTLTLAVETILG